MILLLASLFFTNPVPLEMPRASGYLVTEGNTVRLEDRFVKGDLWMTESVEGRWIDDEDRVFLLARLDTLPPVGDEASQLATRKDFAATRTLINKRNLDAVRTAVAALSPVELPRNAGKPHQMPRGYKDVDYYQGTNRNIIVCAYLPEKEKTWHLAIWQLQEGDDFDEMLEKFEDGFLRKEEKRPEMKELKDLKSTDPEREYLRRDVRHAVAAYPNWHVTDGDSFSIVDDLKDAKKFIIALTNDLTDARKRFAETVPTGRNGTNALSVARIFADRAEYLEALEADGLTNLAWTAAYWSPLRRELVAYWDGTDKKLLSTFRHEAFHQYLSYAATMISVSPWLNEGYAQFFEGLDEEFDYTPTQLEKLSAMIPGILLMDYGEFYSGTDAERRLKYRLAWSLIEFLEKGAPEIRFQPFKNVKKDYFAALFETKNMREASFAAFRDNDLLKRLPGEWLKYWKER